MSDARIAWRTALASTLMLSACGPLFGFEPEGDGGGSGGASAAHDDGATFGGTDGGAAMTTTGPSPDTTTGPSTDTWTDDSTGDIDTSADGASEDDVSFLTQPDIAPGACGGAGGAGLLQCDLFAQDCADGDKCIPWDIDGSGTFNATRCVAVARDPVVVGEACDAGEPGSCEADNCEFGSFCYFRHPATNEGICVEQCGGDQQNPECAEPTACFIGQQGTHNLCLPTCDPLGDPCGDNQQCVPGDDDAFWCVALAQVQADYLETCEQIDQCAGNAACLDPEFAGCDGDDSCCTPYCDLSLGDPNPACPDAANGQTCVAWYPEGQAPDGFDNLGYCQTS